MDKNKGIIIGGIAAALVVGIIVAVVVINANSEPKTGGNGEAGGTSVQDPEDKESFTAADLKNVDETIAYGDYEAQQTLSKAIQNGEKDGKVVKIEGVISNFGKGMSYNIGQRKTEGNQFIGTTFTIEDGTESDYPADGKHVVITGLVKADESGLVHTIKTLKAFVEVKE